MVDSTIRPSAHTVFFPDPDGQNVDSTSKAEKKDGRNCHVIKPATTWLIYYWLKSLERMSL